MKRSAWAFALTLLFAAGCRTYVGSDDVYKTSPPEVLKKEEGLKLKRGVILEVRDGKYIMTFAERSLTRQYEKVKTFYCGRKYYYLQSEQLPMEAEINGRKVDNHKTKIILEIIFSPIIVPFMIFRDFTRSWGFNWKLHGEHAPGIGYCIAYLPIVHLFCFPFLKPPYAYDEAKYGVDFDDTAPVELIKETNRTHYIPVFSLDTSLCEISVTCGGKTLNKKISQNGRSEFAIADFPDVVIEDNVVKFTVFHKAWNQSWCIYSSPVVEPEDVRDWDIASSAGYDYQTRIDALLRLEPALGTKRCCKYLQMLLDGKLNIKPVIRSKIDISRIP